MLLLHGGGLSWWNYRRVAEQLQQDYRIILPILDGHAGSDREFTSIEDNAAEIISFVDHRLGGSVLLFGGLSLGAQILLEILSQKNDICRYAIVESASVIPSGLTNALIAPAFGSSYGLIRNRGFAKVQFRSLHMMPDFFEIDINTEEKYLLCSDGLSNMVEDDEIRDIVSEEDDLNRIAQELVDRANYYGGSDNISVIIISAD